MYARAMIFKVTDHQDRGASGVVQRAVFINTTYIVAMEPWGSKYKAYVGRSLEYVISIEDAERLGQHDSSATAAEAGKSDGINSTD
jgi:hypothetical protein